LSEVTFFDPIQSSIHLVEQRMRTQADGFHPELKSALVHLLSAGGKRIRVAVALLVGRMFQADPDRLVTLAAAIELLHTATLVHDDLIDGALMRRGNPTLNARWTPAATVLTGDFLFAQAANLAADTKSVRVIKLFTETLATICDGEVTQMFDRQLMSDLKGYEKRIYAKTASLFETGAYSAAILSDVDEHIAQDFKRYGYEIGMAFQIVDDILDYTGQQATVGKPVASDLRQGILTLPILFYLEQAKEDPVVTAILDGRRVAEEQIQQLLQAIRACGAVDRAFQEANRHIQAATTILSGYPVCNERLALEELAYFITKRSK
jgi:geranylgeranyl pyrophosphate synthase